MLKLIQPALEFEEQVNEYVKEHFEHGENELSASKGLTSASSYEEWVQTAIREEENPKENWVRNNTYLVIREEDNKLIGLLNIRKEDNERILDWAGHIGYGVRPTERRKGYASEILRLALAECRRIGMKKVMLGCHQDNIGSKKTIEKNNAVYERKVMVEGKPAFVYWIEL